MPDHASSTVPFAGPLAVVGLMGSGKTTVGRELARILGWEAVDGDDVLEAETGLTASELAARDGLDALHAREADVLLRALAGDPHRVLMPAASTIDDARCRAQLQPVFVVWLDARPEVLAGRVAAGGHRPLEPDVAAQLRAQWERRAPLFATVADLTVDSGTLDPDAVVARVLAEVQMPRR